MVFLILDPSTFVSGSGDYVACPSFTKERRMKVFQVVPPVLRDVGKGLEIDVDFLESLKVYLDHFDSLTVACPIKTSNIMGSGLERCVPVRDLPWSNNRLKFIPLPTAYSPLAFLRHIPSVGRILRSEICDADYLIFSPCGLFGDWPTVAIREAIKLRRSYVVEADSDKVSVMRRNSQRDTLWKRLVKNTFVFPLTNRSIIFCLSHSSLAVFQGEDVYKAYAPFSPNAHKLNHHIPIYPGEHITEDQLQAKLSSLCNGAPLKICYAGRAVDVKAPLDWLETLQALTMQGIKFEATWLGDGPLITEMREKVATFKMSNVTLPGYISDRERLLNALKEAHIFLFCHTSRESARILGEALACGCALVGYSNNYAADLVAEHGGGIFSEIGDPAALAATVQHLQNHIGELCNLIQHAAQSGRDFDRHVALKKRIELVKRTR